MKLERIMLNGHMHTKAIPEGIKEDLLLMRIESFINHSIEVGRRLEEKGGRKALELFTQDYDALVAQAVGKRVTLGKLEGYIHNFPAVKEVFETIQQFQEDYITVAQKGLDPLRKVFMHENMNGPEAAAYVARTAKNIPREHIATLALITGGTEKKKEFFEYACEQPEVLSTFEALRKTQAPLPTLITFITSTGIRPLPNGKQVQAVTAELASNNKYRSNAKYIIETQAEALFGEQSTRTLDLLTTYEHAHIALAMCKQAQQRGENSAAVALSIASAKLPAAELHALRAKLSTFTNEELAWAHTTPTTEHVSYFTRQKKSKTAQPAPERVKTVQLHRPLIAELQAEEVAPETISRIEALYPTQTGIGRRLTQVWTDHPEAIEQFSLLAERYGNSEAFNLLIRDNDLFRNYLNRIDDAYATDQLIRFFEQAEGNVKAQLQNILIPQKPRDVFTAPVTATQTHTPNYIASRIIIVGGDLRTKEIETFEEKVPVRVLCYTMKNVHDAKNAVREGDAVIGLVKSLSHSAETVIIDACKAIPVPYRKSYAINANRVMNDIRPFLPAQPDITS